MNSMFKNALMATLLISAGSAACNIATSELFDKTVPLSNGTNRIFTEFWSNQDPLDLSLNWNCYKICDSCFMTGPEVTLHSNGSISTPMSFLYFKSRSACAMARFNDQMRAKTAALPRVTEDTVFDAYVTNYNSYWAQFSRALAQATQYARDMSFQSIDYARANTPEWVAQTCAYLAEMPKPADGASLGGYGTTDNAKNVLAKVGAAAVVAAAGYVVYKIAFKKTKKYV